MDSERLGRMSEARLGHLKELLEQDRLEQLRKMELADSQEELLHQQGVTRYLSKQIETIERVVNKLQRGEKTDGRSERTGY